jgi:hypothetical protein
MGFHIAHFLIIPPCTNGLECIKDEENVINKDKLQQGNRVIGYLQRI